MSAFVITWAWENIVPFTVIQDIRIANECLNDLEDGSSQWSLKGSQKYVQSLQPITGLEICPSLQPKWS